MSWRVSACWIEWGNERTGRMLRGCILQATQSIMPVGQQRVAAPYRKLIDSSRSAQKANKGRFGAEATKKNCPPGNGGPVLMPS